MPLDDQVLCRVGTRGAPLGALAPLPSPAARRPAAERVAHARLRAVERELLDVAAEEPASARVRERLGEHDGVVAVPDRRVDDGRLARPVGCVEQRAGPVAVGEVGVRVEQLDG